jgi:hypothetical protein
MLQKMLYLTFSAFKCVFDRCVVSLNKCSPFYDNIHITAGSGCYGMSRKFVQLCVIIGTDYFYIQSQN